MTTFPGSPKLLKGGIVLLDSQSSTVRRVIPLQYNPDSVTRTLQTQAVETGEGGDRSQALRIKGPPIETIKLDAELDATDALERGNPQSIDKGLFPLLAALETIIYPESQRLITNNGLANAGALEIFPVMAPLSLFVWSKHRIVPVRITDFSVTEEAFDPNLNPIRAKVSLSMRVLSITDLGFNTRGGSLFMVYQQHKEQLAAETLSRNVEPLGIGGIP